MTGKLILTPVVNTRSDMDYVFGENHLRGSFWTDGAVLSHNAMQIDAYNGMDQFNSREDLQLRDNVFVFSDASGKKLSDAKSGDVPSEAIAQKVSSRLTARRVIDWQLNVADAGTTLGVPLNHDGSAIDAAKLEAALKESVNNAAVADNVRLQGYTRNNFKLFAYVDGFTYREFDYWVNEMKSAIQVDGYSFIGKSKTVPNILAIRLGYMLGCEGAPIHVSGSLNSEDIMLIAYASKYLNANIYFDTMLHHAGKAYKQYVNIFDYPHTMGLSAWKQHPECPCPVCKFADIIDPSYHTYYGILISLHNLFESRSFVALAESLVKNEAEFNNFAKHISDSLIRNMAFLDAVARDGFEKAYYAYFEPNESIDEWVHGKPTQIEVKSEVQKALELAEKFDKTGKIKRSRKKK